MIRLLVLAGLVLATVPIHAQRAATTPTFLVNFGGVTDDPAEEMLRVGSVLRLSNDRFVVANGKPPELRIYDARGRLSRVISRRGGGPGEYQYGVTVLPWPGDSLLAFTQGNDRWMLFGADGTLVREWPASDAMPRPPIGVFLHGSAIISRSVIGSVGCPRTAIERHAPRSARTLQEAVSDADGRLWLHALGGTTWTVYEPNGSMAAAFRLPAEFRITQFDGDRVIGVHPDDDGFSRIVMFRTGLPARRVATVDDCSSIPIPVDRTRATHIKTAVRNAMTYNEAHYSRNKTYAADAGDYPSEVKPSGTDFVVHSASDRGYAFSITDKATGWRCMVSVGGGDPVLDGVLLCGS